jgi:ribonuclease HI
MYAVAKGRTVGIFSTWAECSASVKGFSGAVYKKFDTETLARDFIDANSAQVLVTTSCSKIDGIDCYNSEFVPAYYVYTDGACSNNGRENAMAGIGVFFGIDDPRNVSQRVSGKQTNNTAELTAIEKVYSILESDILSGIPICIVSDSEYAIRCVTTYGEKCAVSQWKKVIPNMELVRHVYELYHGKSNVRFLHVDAHTGKTDVHSIGNDHADRLANLSVEFNSETIAELKWDILIPQGSDSSNDLK